MFDVKVKLHTHTHMYCSFGHNLFKTCGSASPIFLARFDTVIRVLISGFDVEESMQHLRARGPSLGGVAWWWVMGGCEGGEGVSCVPRPLRQQGHNVEAKLLISSSPLVHFGSHMMRLLKYLRPDLTGVQYVRNLWWRKFWDFLGRNWTFGLLISLINKEGSTWPPMVWPNQATMDFDRAYPGVRGTIYPKNCDDASPRFFVGTCGVPYGLEK